MFRNDIFDQILDIPAEVYARVLVWKKVIGAKTPWKIDQQARLAGKVIMVHFLGNLVTLLIKSRHSRKTFKLLNWQLTYLETKPIFFVGICDTLTRKSYKKKIKKIKSVCIFMGGISDIRPCFVTNFSVSRIFCGRPLGAFNKIILSID